MDRLSGLPTLRINHDQKLVFHHHRSRYEGLAGDTIATALYAGLCMVR